MKTSFDSLIIECANVAEMRELSNGAKQFPIGGLQAKAVIAVSGMMHYFVLIDENYRERAMRWLNKHLYSTILDLSVKYGFGYDDLTSSARMACFVQQILRDTLEAEYACIEQKQVI